MAVRKWLAIHSETGFIGGTHDCVQAYEFDQLSACFGNDAIFF
jgi:hypothetical protein